MPILQTIGALVGTAIILAAWYSLVACGFAITFYIARFFDMSLGVAMLAAAYVAFAVSPFLAPPFAMISGIVAGAVLNLILGYFVVVPVARKVSSLRLFVATLGLVYICQAAAGLVFGESSIQLHWPNERPLLSEILRINDVQGALVLVSCVTVVTLLALVHYSRWGRYARAISDDPLLASRYGLPVNSLLCRCYVLAGVLGGIAATFQVAGRAVTTNQATASLLAAMVAAIIGGNTIGGAIAGACMLAVLETICGFAVPGDWATTIAFLVLLLFLLTRKAGLFELAERQT